jgi:hypothetical protein
MEEIPLNTDFGIKNERQDYKIVWCGEASCRGRMVNGGDEGEGIWLMGFIYMYELDNETSCNCFKWGRKGVGSGRRWWRKSNQCTM